MYTKCIEQFVSEHFVYRYVCCSRAYSFRNNGPSAEPERGPELISDTGKKINNGAALRSEV